MLISCSRVAAITPRVLEDYQEMIRDTSNDLQEHLQRLDEKVQNLTESPQHASDKTEWDAFREEKESTQQGLEICAQLSTRIEQLRSTVKEHHRWSDRPSASKLVKSSLSSANSTVEDLMSRLQAHELEVGKHMQMLRVGGSQASDGNLDKLRETQESIRQCVDVVSQANDGILTERRNVFEDITMADDSYDFSVSTVGDLVTARRINLKGRARHVGGQISDESYQKTIEAFSQLDMQYAGQLPHAGMTSSFAARSGIGQHNANQQAFQDRHGPGSKLSPLAGADNPPNSVRR